MLKAADDRGHDRYGVAITPGDVEVDHQPLWLGTPWRHSVIRSQPSCLASIEELPVALGALRWGDGYFHRTLQAGVVYGRDCDSIAAMALNLWGALLGTTRICPSLMTEVGRGSRRDLPAIGRAFAVTCQGLHVKDAERWQRRAALWRCQKLHCPQYLCPRGGIAAGGPLPGAIGRGGMAITG